MMRSVAEEEIDTFALPVDWSGADDAPVLAVNQVVTQLGPSDHPGEITLVLGYVSAPVILAEGPDEVRRQLSQLKAVRVRVAGRFSLSRERLDELIRVLQITADKHDRIAGSGTGGSDDAKLDSGRNLG
jgi:hypothetical protein